MHRFNEKQPFCALISTFCENFEVKHAGMAPKIKNVPENSINPILHIARLDNHALTSKSNTANIILVKNPLFFIPS